MGQTAPTILMIEDDLNIRKMARARLQREGYRVLMAPDGHAGLELARVEHPDVILLDIILPNLDGRAVLRRLTEDPRTRGIPVILLSVVEEGEVMRPLKSAGALFHLTKPYQTQELLRTIRLALSQASGETVRTSRPHGPPR